MPEIATLDAEVEAAAANAAEALETCEPRPTPVPAVVAEARFQAEEQIGTLAEDLDSAPDCCGSCPGSRGARAAASIC